MKLVLFRRLEEISLALDMARHYLVLFFDRVIWYGSQWMFVCLCKTLTGKHMVGFRRKQDLLLWDEYAAVEHVMNYLHISLTGANSCVT